MTHVTTVMKRGPANFNMVGQFLSYPLMTLPESISKGLATRLARYAVQRASESGFEPLIKVAQVEVYTLDGDDPPANRTYCVRFKTPQGGYLELVGIHTKSGWPFLDHNFAVGVD